MTAREAVSYDPTDLKNHPFFSLKLDWRIKLLNGLGTWLLETDEIKKMIDDGMKTVKRGIRPFQSTVRFLFRVFLFIEPVMISSILRLSNNSLYSCQV